MTETTPTAGDEWHVAPDSPPPRPSRPEAAFFTWVRGMRVVRDHGWLGGVCGGISVRVGIDPLIVRGIFVVVAIIGFPALLVYALGWALLPDTEGRIHVQELGRGRFDPAMIAIAILTLLTFLPGVQWVWSAIFWPLTGGVGGWGAERIGLFGVLDGVLVFLTITAGIALAVGLIIWAVRYPGDGAPRAGRTRDVVPPTVSIDGASPGAGQESAAGDGAVGASALDAQEIRDVAPIEPPPPQKDAADDELAQWRLNHEQWRAEHAAWRQRSAAADAAARERSREDRRQAARAFADEVAERRRIRRLASPRASVVFVLAVLGAALIGGGLSALTIGDPAVAVPASLLVAGGIVAVGMIAAGAARRRSGFLALVATIAVVAGIVAGFVAAMPTVLFASASIATIGSAPQSYLQPFGYSEIALFDVTQNAPGDEREQYEAGEIALRKGTGDTAIWVASGTTVVLDATLGDGRVEVVGTDGSTGGGPSTEDVTATVSDDGSTRYRAEISGSAIPDSVGTIVPVRIEQASGSVRIMVTTTGDS